METLWKFTLVAFSGLCLLTSVISIRCYRCNSHDDPKRCFDGNNIYPGYLQECNTKAVKDEHDPRLNTIPGCWKTVIRYEASHGNPPLPDKIVRDCGHVYPEKSNQCQYRGAGGSEEGLWWFECGCDSHACNSGWSISAQSSILMTGVLSAFLVYKL